MRNAASHQQPQPEDLSTGERLKMTLGAVAQGIRYALKGQHQTEDKGELVVEPADVDRRQLAGAHSRTSPARFWPSTARRTRPPPLGCSGTATTPDTYRLLVLERGSTLDDYEQWFSTSLVATLLAGNARA